MSEQERIVCAAVRMKFTESELCQEIFQNVMCLNYKDSIIEDVKALYDDVLWDIEEEIHGFMTSEGRFVEPIEAQKIAIACGQYKDPHTQIRLLEESIEIGWHSLERARTGVLKHTMRNEIAKDQKRLDELKAGYLGYELRVEDLHYVSSK